ncbi:CLUMA_CG009404, isoform A [Clunio marinus]|uniref:CLUMA_CG009404, isoform A n=1 Tax=Clunio marinus TaxID=568069 RepID=A0A1J1IBZ7_9DIPT|nr:CLUMA_CG009404, isoform A [Clunio marinus]
MEKESKTNTFQIEHLNGENYSTWAFKMQAILEIKDVWITIESEARPEGITAEIWKDKESRARQLIALHVEGKEVVHIKKSKTGKEAWNEFKTMYQRRTAGAQMRTIRNLTSLRFKPEENMRDHMNKIAKWIDDLSEQDEPLKEKFACAIILGSVSGVYGNLVTAIEAWNSDNITIKNVRGAIIEEWEKKKAEAELEDVDRFKVYHPSF